jgi:hypothetical protein
MLYIIASQLRRSHSKVEKVPEKMDELTAAVADSLEYATSNWIDYLKDKIV